MLQIKKQIRLKKFFITILAITYLAGSAGATVYMHYCMGEIFSVDLAKAKDDCSKCGMKSNKHCCNDELKTIKLSDSHNAASNNINLLAPVFAIADNTQNSHNFSVVTTTSAFAVYNNFPPEPSGRTRCIFNCIFKI